jgi:hypothetical protein
MLTVNVTQADIDAAIDYYKKKGEIIFSWGSNCPVAQALKRTGHEHVIVFLTWAVIDNIMYDMPDETFVFIRKVDDYVHRQNNTPRPQPTTVTFEEYVK